MLDKDIKKKIYEANKLLCSIIKEKTFTDKYHIHLLEFVEKTYYTKDKYGWFTLCDECKVRWNIKHYKDYTVVKRK